MRNYGFILMESILVSNWILCYSLVNCPSLLLDWSSRF